MTQPTDKRFVMENRLDAEIAQVNDALDTKVDLTDPRLADERTPLDNSVTSAKIANGTIVDADINATAAIAKTKIAGTAVTQADTGTVTSTMIADGTVTGTDIASGTVTETNLAALDYVKFDTTYAGGSTQPGMLAWDQSNETLQFQLDPHVTLQVGQEHVMRVKNASGTVAIPERTVVMFAGATGNTIKVAPAVSNGSVNVNYLAGITTEEIPADGFGFVTQLGFINHTNTNGWAVGTILYVDPTVPGGLTPTEPELPAWTMPVAAVTKQNSSAGRMLVRAIPGGSGAGGSSVVISDTVPAGGTKGDLWLDSTEGTLYIFFEDADSSQWVQVKANSALEGSILSRLGALESTQAAALQSTTAVTNLVPNPSFETNTTGWTAVGSTLTRVTTEKYVGTASMSVATTAETKAGYAQVDNLPVSTTYTFSIWVKAESGKDFELQLHERTSGNVLVGISYGGVKTGTGNWERHTVTRVFGATGAQARAAVFNKTAGAHTFYVDGAQLEVGSTPTDYFDGSTAAANGYVYGWTGVPHASVSIKRWNGIAGLVPILPGSVVKVGTSSVASANEVGQVTFSACEAISLDGVFSPAYRNYRVLLNVTDSSATAEVRIRFRTGGVDQSTSPFYWGGFLGNNGGGTQAYAGAGVTYLVVGTTRGSAIISPSVDLNIFNPNTANMLSFSGLLSFNAGGSSQWGGSFGGEYQTAQQFDGMKLYLSAAGNFGGTITVYGFND